AARHPVASDGAKPCGRGARRRGADEVIGILEAGRDLVSELRRIAHHALPDGIARLLDEAGGVAVVGASPSVVVTQLDGLDGTGRGETRSATLPEPEPEHAHHLLDGADPREGIEGGDGLAVRGVGGGDDHHVRGGLPQTEIAGIEDAALVGFPPGEIREAQGPHALLRRERRLGVARRELEGGLHHAEEALSVLPQVHLRMHGELGFVLEGRLHRGEEGTTGWRRCGWEGDRGRAHLLACRRFGAGERGSREAPGLEQEAPVTALVVGTAGPAWTSWKVGGGTRCRLLGSLSSSGDSGGRANTVVYSFVGRGRPDGGIGAAWR